MKTWKRKSFFIMTEADPDAASRRLLGDVAVLRARSTARIQMH
jgi:hypothetical protein